ncbi:MAG: hypothetical protein ACT4TC_20050 [Myxococcaceae bacterium]
MKLFNPLNLRAALAFRGADKGTTVSFPHFYAEWERAKKAVRYPLEPSQLAELEALARHPGFLPWMKQVNTRFSVVDLLRVPGAEIEKWTQALGRPTVLEDWKHIERCGPVGIGVLRLSKSNRGTEEAWQKCTAEIAEVLTQLQRNICEQQHALGLMANTARGFGPELAAQLIRDARLTTSGALDHVRLEELTELTSRALLSVRKARPDLIGAEQGLVLGSEQLRGALRWQQAGEALHGASEHEKAVAAALPSAGELLHQFDPARANELFTALADSVSDVASRAYEARAAGKELAIPGANLTAVRPGSAQSRQLAAESLARVALANIPTDVAEKRLPALASFLLKVDRFHPHTPKQIFALAEALPNEDLREAGRVFNEASRNLRGYVLAPEFIERVLRGAPPEQRLPLLRDELSSLASEGPVGQTLEWNGFWPKAEREAHVPALNLGEGSFSKAWRVGRFVLKGLKESGFVSQRERLQNIRGDAERMKTVLDTLRSHPTFGPEWGHVIPESWISPGGFLTQRAQPGVAFKSLPSEFLDRAKLQEEAATKALRSALRDHPELGASCDDTRGNFLFDVESGDLLSWFDPVYWPK